MNDETTFEHDNHSWPVYFHGIRVARLLSSTDSVNSECDELLIVAHRGVAINHSRHRQRCSRLRSFRHLFLFSCLLPTMLRLGRVFCIVVINFFVLQHIHLPLSFLHHPPFMFRCMDMFPCGSPYRMPYSLHYSSVCHTYIYLQ